MLKEIFKHCFPEKPPFLHCFTQKNSAGRYNCYFPVIMTEQALSLLTEVTLLPQEWLTGSFILQVQLIALAAEGLHLCWWLLFWNDMGLWETCSGSSLQATHNLLFSKICLLQKFPPWDFLGKQRRWSKECCWITPSESAASLPACCDCVWRVIQLYGWNQGENNSELWMKRPGRWQRKMGSQDAE